jgi:hypothetical protein
MSFLSTYLAAVGVKESYFFHVLAIFLFLVSCRRSKAAVVVRLAFPWSVEQFMSLCDLFVLTACLLHADKWFIGTEGHQGVDGKRHHQVGCCAC